MNLALLQDIVRRRRPDLLPLAMGIGRMPLSAEQWNDLRLAVGDELIATGFAASWKPNERGLELERLIDQLAPWHHLNTEPN